MTPLETWLDNRGGKAFQCRLAWSRWITDFPNGLKKLASQLIWPRRLKHERYLPPEITLDAKSNGQWTILKNSNPLAKSKALRELIPPIASSTSIIATGPSALEYSWGNLGNCRRFLIAVNGAPTMLKNFGVVPDLLVVTDREFARTGFQHLEVAPGVPLAIEFLAAAALASVAPQLLTDRPFAIIERVNMWHALPMLDDATIKDLNEASGKPFSFPERKDTKCRVGWSHRPDLGIFSGRTVVFGALQIAIGLGATDVEIIGMDLNGAGRAYDEGNKQRPTQLQQHYQEFILPSFEVMSRVLAGSNVSVRNISPVCPLPDDFFTGLSQSNRREIL
jgi:KDO transferase-3